jgi:hypothetical protein
MSDALLAYIISVVILAALALLIPCIELLAKLLRTPLYDEGKTPAPSLKVRDIPRKVA